MNKHHCGPASHTVQYRPWTLGLPPLLLWGWGWGSGEDWIKGHSSDSSSLVVIGDWEGREGKRGRRQWNPVDKLSTTLPQILLTPLPKNSLAEDTFNNIFLFLKKYSDKPSICPSPCLALPGAMTATGVGKLSAVGLLLFKQSHGKLGTASQPLQIAEATAVV